MIINGTAAKNGMTLESDVCVVGAGAAGLTLALDLAQRGLEVVLVESGGLKFQKWSNDLLDVEQSGQTTDRLVMATRERFFGGTTNHWGGEIRTLDKFEFEHHPWIPHSGWPISRSDLEPYYEKAAGVLGLPEVDRPFDAEATGFIDRPRLVSESEEEIEAQLWRTVPHSHLRMGTSRRAETRQSKQIRCVLNTTILEIHPDESNESIASMEGRTRNGLTLHFRAKDFVLCTGAIENARLLLASDSVVPEGLGNEHDLVGRFFMDHGATPIGPIVVTDPAAGSFQEELMANSDLAGWATSTAAREQHQLRGFVALQWPKARVPQAPLEHAVGIHSLVNPQSASVEAASPRYLQVTSNWEQSPNPLSRVTLSKQVDRFGARKPKLHWDVVPDDLTSARRSSELLSLAIARSGYGRLRRMGKLTTAGPMTWGGGHQMGTTRMSSDPESGVTDADGRVHSLSNLFIGGSSLFPTGGWQNPTFTIVALALRQADHLAARATVRKT